MTRLFTTGAEETDPSAVWDTVISNIQGNFVPLQFFGNTEIMTVAPRTGRGCYALTSLNTLKNDFGVDTTHTELFFGFAVRFSFLPTDNIFFSVGLSDPGASNHFDSLRIRTDGSIKISDYGGTLIVASAPGVILVNTWHYIEYWIKPLHVNGRLLVKVDGVTVIDFTGDNTTYKEWINFYQFTGVDTNQSHVSTLFDDIVVNDQNGDDNNTYPGIVLLLPIRPHSTGNYSQWTRAGTDLGTDEAQMIEGAYEFAMLQTSSADQLQTATPEIPDLPVGAVIKNIVVSARARVQAGAGMLAPMVRSNGTDSISADQTLLSNWKNKQYAWHHNPDDSADWDEADLATLEIGVSS